MSLWRTMREYGRNGLRISWRENGRTGLRISHGAGKTGRRITRRMLFGRAGMTRRRKRISMIMAGGSMPRMRMAMTGGSRKNQDYDDAPSDGICRQPAPWAANKGHVANNDRDQRVPGEAWITEDGEKVWTHAETGVTYASH